jgi:formylglycine-generating enzyme required for sulfatase activity
MLVPDEPLPTRPAEESAMSSKPSIVGDTVEVVVSGFAVGGIVGAVSWLAELGGVGVDHPVAAYVLQTVAELLIKQIIRDPTTQLDVVRENDRDLYDRTMKILDERLPDLSDDQKHGVAERIARFPLKIARRLDWEPRKDEPTLPAGLSLDREEFMESLLLQRISSLKKGVPLAGGWLLDKCVGVGGFGEVWRATPPPGRGYNEAALKFCVDDPPGASSAPAIDKQRALRHERELIGRVMNEAKGEGIVELLDDQYLDHDPPFLVYRFIRGADLPRAYRAAVDAKDKPHWWQVAKIMRQIAKCLVPAHKLNIVHRDLKPTNILVCGNPTNPSDYCYFITDFGIGGVATKLAIQRGTANAESRGATPTGTTEAALRRFYTRRYASREQQNPREKPQLADDIYALGVIMFEMLLGDFEAEAGPDWERQVSGLLPRRGIPLLDACFAPRKDRLPDAQAFIASVSKLLLADDLLDLDNTTLWARLDAGPFLMGSDADEPSRGHDEEHHPVNISRPFYMLKHPVTQEEFQRVMGSNPSFWNPTRVGRDTNHFPVEYVTWDEAVAFCRELNDAAADQGYAIHFQLPTEAEWEYACRAGTPPKTLYSLRNRPAERLESQDANFDGSFPYPLTARPMKALKQTCAIGRYPENAWGLYDMHGNVREWCSDRYADYDLSVVADPIGPDQGTDRVVRGGCWHDIAVDCRCAKREKHCPTEPDARIGFRIIALRGS